MQHNDAAGRTRGLPELGRLTRREIASLVGYAPFTRQKWKGKSMIAGRRPAARSAIFMAALGAIRCNPILRAFISTPARSR